MSLEAHARLPGLPGLRPATKAIVRSPRCGSSCQNELAPVSNARHATRAATLRSLASRGPLAGQSNYRGGVRLSKRPLELRLRPRLDASASDWRTRLRSVRTRHKAAPAPAALRGPRA